MTVIIGVDPGPTTGICMLPDTYKPQLIQMNHTYVMMTLHWLVERYDPDYIAVEAWAPGKARGQNANTTRDLIQDTLNAWPYLFRQRTASAVKGWATDKRLAAVSSEFARDATGMRHARDAGRHALFCAVHDAGMPDPLSRKAKCTCGGPIFGGSTADPSCPTHSKSKLTTP
jgi:hypothetical protein